MRDSVANLRTFVLSGVFVNANDSDPRPLAARPRQQPEVHWMTVGLIIFDCDGVLVDSERISCRCTAEVLGEAGFEVGEDAVLAKYMGLSDESMKARIEAEWGLALPVDFTEAIQQRTLSAFETLLQPVDGVEAVLDVLTSPRCVASSGTPERIRRALSVTGLLSRFEPHLFSAAMVEQGKPAPDLFLHAATRLGVAPSQCVVIEDSTFGVKAGKAAGMRVFGFAGASHVEPDSHVRTLIEAGADLSFQWMRELPSLLAVEG